jgi:hypothetical protein
LSTWGRRGGSKRRSANCTRLYEEEVGLLLEFPEGEEGYTLVRVREPFRSSMNGLSEVLQLCSQFDLDVSEAAEGVSFCAAPLSVDDVHASGIPSNEIFLAFVSDVRGGPEEDEDDDDVPEEYLRQEIRYLGCAPTADDALALACSAVQAELAELSIDSPAALRARVRENDRVLESLQKIVRFEAAGADGEEPAGVFVETKSDRALRELINSCISYTFDDGDGYRGRQFSFYIEATEVAPPPGRMTKATRKR